MTAVLPDAPATDQAVDVADVRYIPIGQIRESPLNPRQHYSTASLTELAESLRKGQVVPVIVRPVPGFRIEPGSLKPRWAVVNPKGVTLSTHDDEDAAAAALEAMQPYELAAGHRRFRAAKLAGLAVLKADVQPMSDDRLLEILVIENLQREDVHPLDEALGYQEFMKRPGVDVAAIAEKIGKSESYVHRRLKLADLIEPAKKAFWADKITAAHAVEIARLQPKDQKAALEACFQSYGPKALVAVASLRQFIQSSLLLELQGAAFDKADATLLPVAGACTACPKRTGFAPSLFGDIAKKDSCTDRTCFEQKRVAHVGRRAAELEAEGTPFVRIAPSSYSQSIKEKGVLGYDQFRVCKKQDKGAKLAITVDGPDAGTTSYITQEREVYANSGGGQESWKAQQRKQEAKAKLKAQIRRQTFDAIVPKLPASLGADELRTVVHGFLAEMTQDKKKVLCDVRGWEGIKGQYGSWDYDKPVKAAVEQLTVAELGRLLLALPLMADLLVTPHYMKERGPGPLAAAAKRYGINAAKIARVAMAAAAAAEKAKANKSKQANKNKKRAGDVARAKKATRTRARAKAAK